MILKRIDPISCAKVYGVICVFIGFIAGLLVAVVAWLVGQMFGAGGGQEYSSGLSIFFGIGAVIAYPILYGVLGFVLGFLSSVIYNWIAGAIGGIELEFE